MAFPQRLLHAGEEVFCDQRPHPVRLAYPITVSSVVLGALIFGFLVWSSAPAAFGALLGAVFLGDAVYLTSRILAWRSRSFVVTSHRVIYRSGMWRRAGREIPIDAVQQVTYRQSLPARLIRHGTLAISAAGDDSEQLVPDVRDPERVQTQVHAAMEAATRRRYGAGADPAVEGDLGEVGESDPARELERLEILHRRGVITAAEFERARAGLRGREPS